MAIKSPSAEPMGRGIGGLWYVPHLWYLTYLTHLCMQSRTTFLIRLKGAGWSSLQEITRKQTSQATIGGHGGQKYAALASRDRTRRGLETPFPYFLAAEAGGEYLPNLPA